MSVNKQLKKRINELIDRIKKIKKRSIYIFIVGILFAVMSFFLNRDSIYIRPYEIERGLYGTQKAPYKLKVDVQNLQNNMEFDIAVSARKWTKEEADVKFLEKMDELQSIMLNENVAYDYVQTKLNFPIDLGDGIKASYTFEPSLNGENDEYKKVSTISSVKKDEKFDYYVKYQRLIDGSGNVKNEDFKIDEICTGFINVRLSTEIKDKDGTYKSNTYSFPITVVSRDLSELDAFKNAFNKEIENSDKGTIDENTIKLPKVVNNYKISYKDNIDLSFLLVPVFAIIIIFGLEYRDKEKIREEEKKKRRSLELDYATIISKMLIYVSSGMTIRNANIRLAEQYIKKVKSGNMKRRVAYDELVLVKNKLESGYSETKAYEEMAKNINMRAYTRFLNIIIQSIKNGNKEFKNILNMEVQDALYERKQRAKKMGEEASTKLILPLMMMLMIIMVVVMTPAFMGF